MGDEFCMIRGIPFLPARIQGVLPFPARIRARARLNDAKEAEEHEKNLEF